MAGPGTSHRSNSNLFTNQSNFCHMKGVFCFKSCLLMFTIIMASALGTINAQPTAVNQKAYGTMGTDTAAATGSAVTIYFYPGENELTSAANQFYFPGNGSLSTGIVLDSLSGTGNGATSVTAQLQVSNSATAPGDSDESWMDLSGTNATITQNGTTTTSGPYYSTTDFTYRWFRWKVTTAATTISIEGIPWYQFKRK